MIEVMIDFETFGSGTTAVVVQIGAAYFNRETGEVGKKFKCNVDASSYIGRGFGKIDPDTVYWWLSKSQEARESILADPKLGFIEAFAQLNDFLSDAQKVWCHATFDFPILQETLKATKNRMRCKWSAARDIRTLIDLSGYDYGAHPRSGTHHDALDDCLHQIAYCVAAIKKLKGVSV